MAENANVPYDEVGLEIILSTHDTYYNVALHHPVQTVNSEPGKLLSTWRMTCSLSPTLDDVCCDLPVTEPVSFHGHITVSATEASLPPDPECGTLYLKNSDRTQVSDSLGAN